MNCRSTPVKLAGGWTTGAASLLGLFWPLAGTSAAESLQTEVRNDTIVIRAGERELLVYRRTPNPYKLYVQAWSTPAGRQILRDSPHDHIHHRALMYAIGVDGVDFWTENPRDRPGKQVPIGQPAVSVSAMDGAETVTIGQQIQWQDAGGQVLLQEARGLTLHHQAVPGVGLLTWDSRFDLPPEKEKAELWGRHYFGLGLRMVTGLDQGGEVRNAGGDAGESVRGTERLSRGAWCAYTAPLDGRPVTVAMFDHPDNRRGATWFTMTGPFAYLAATLNLDREPMTLSAENPLRLRYGLAVWDANPSVAEIAAAYAAWQKLASQ